jgi:hypothetical protein
LKGGESSYAEDDDPRSELPAQEGEERGEGDSYIHGRAQGTGADRTNPCGDKHSDDGGIDAAQDGLDWRALAKAAPERQDGYDGE